MEQRTLLGCLQRQIAPEEQVPAPHNLGPQNLDMAFEKRGGTGSEIARQYVSTTQGNRKTMHRLRELEKRHFKVAAVVSLNIYPEMGGCPLHR